MKALTMILIALVLTFTIPALGLLMLMGLSIYLVAKSETPRYSSLAQYGLMSFNNREENKIPEIRSKDYHDYQIEAFLSARRFNKVSEIENIELSVEEERAFREIEKNLKNDN